MMSDMDKVSRERMAILLNIMGVGKFGSLYFVPEEVWKARIGRRYDQGSNRVGHPGCSISRQQWCSSLEPVQMLHGSSRKRKNAFVVKGVMGDSKATYFSTLVAPISHLYWTKQVKNKIRRAPKGDLDKEEKVKLMEFCAKRGM